MTNIKVGSSDFSVEEFKKPYSINKLYEALKKADIYLKDNTIQELNQLLKDVDLYNIFTEKYKDKKLSENIISCPVCH